MAHPLSRTDVRLGLAVALIAVFAVGAGAYVVGGSETVRPLGRVLNIAVVAPVEPAVMPGETMEVGALNDGFDRAVLDRAAVQPFDDTYTPEPAWIGDESPGDPTPRMPVPTPVHEARGADIRPPLADPLADGSRAFGFDTPRPNYGAERTARLNRIEAVASEGGAASTTESVQPVQYSSE